MFEVQCVKELFRPQKLLSINSLKVIFGKLAHSSIMKLNDAAMDKVYINFVTLIKYDYLFLLLLSKLCDLMVMAAKYQVGQY